MHMEHCANGQERKLWDNLTFRECLQNFWTVRGKSFTFVCSCGSSVQALSSCTVCWNFEWFFVKVILLSVHTICLYNACTYGLHRYKRSLHPLLSIWDSSRMLQKICLFVETESSALFCRSHISLQLRNRARYNSSTSPTQSITRIQDWGRQNSRRAS